MKLQQTVTLPPPALPAWALNCIVFISGGCVMIMELTGTRLMAPYLGTSIFVWTSLIGVILGCLSLGYWLGGKLADRRPDPKRLALLLLTSGVLVAAVALIGDMAMIRLQRLIVDIRAGSVVATLLLFGLPSVCLGMIAPFAVRLKLTSLDQSGATAGGLYALSTLGSIAGTFLAGFYLLSHFSHRTVFFIISLALMLLAPLAWRSIHKVPTAALVLATLGLMFTRPWLEIAVGDGFVEEHTAYNRVWIFDGFVNERPVRFLQLNDTYDSAIYTDNGEPVLEYGRYFRLASHFHPNLQKALMIGGGAYSLPITFLNEHSNTVMDVVEIDPGLQKIAANYFGVSPHPRLNIVHEDGRTFLNRSQPGYSVVFGDAVKSATIPFHLATREAMQNVHRILDDHGVLIMNVISTAGGDESQFFQALLATLDEVFPQVLAFAVRDTNDAQRIQNFIVVGLKSTLSPALTSNDPEISTFLAMRWTQPIARGPVLTDRFAPVERLTKPMVTRHPELRYGYVQQSVEEYFNR